MTPGKYRVNYSASAKNDLRAIFTYIAHPLKARLTAARQINRLKAAALALDSFPERHEIVERGYGRTEIRKFSVDNYIVFYSVNSQTKIVTIVRIFYGGRDVKNITVTEEQ